MDHVRGVTATAVGTMRRLRPLLLATTAGLSVVYFVVGLRPEMPAAVVGVSDVVVHGVGYGLLALCAAATASAWAAARPGVVGMLYAIGHGVLLELLQRAVPARTAELKDVIVDAAAALLGALPWLWRRR